MLDAFGLCYGKKGLPQDFQVKTQNSKLLFFGGGTKNSYPLLKY